MKIFMLVLGFAITFASPLWAHEGLYYSEGPKRGEPVLEATYVGTYELCFVGRPSAAKKQLWTLISDDIEKENPFVRLDKDLEYLVYGYTDTKCLDEGESRRTCRVVQTVHPCRSSDWE